MSRHSALFILLLFLATACGRRAAEAPAEPTGTGKPDGAPTADMPAETGAPTEDAQLPALLAGLTQEVRRFGVEQRRVPKDLEELVALGYLVRVPPAPPGRKFVITQELQVVLTRP